MKKYLSIKFIFFCSLIILGCTGTKLEQHKPIGMSEFKADDEPCWTRAPDCIKDNDDYFFFVGQNEELTPSWGRPNRATFSSAQSNAQLQYAKYLGVFVDSRISISKKENKYDFEFENIFELDESVKQYVRDLYKVDEYFVSNAKTYNGKPLWTVYVLLKISKENVKKHKIDVFNNSKRFAKKEKVLSSSHGKSSVVKNKINMITFDAVTDFSLSDNSETSVWSYRYSNDLKRDENYSLLQRASPYCGNGENSWRRTGSSAWGVIYVGIGVNRSGRNVVCPFSKRINWPDNTLFMHPGGRENTPPGKGLVVLSWLAPKAGIIDISFYIKDMDPFGGDGVEWFIDAGGAGENIASGVANSSITNNLNTGLQKIRNVSVSLGGRINFIVSPGMNGSHLFDSTQVKSTISFYPEN